MKLLQEEAIDFVFRIYYSSNLNKGDNITEIDTSKLDYCLELFKDNETSYFNNTISIDMQIEPYELTELIDTITPHIEDILPKLNLKIDSYRNYEEEYGGFCYYGVLQFDIEELSFKELDLMKELLFNYNDL